MHVFLVLNTTEINTNGKADCKFLGLHETTQKQKGSVMPGECGIHGKLGGNMEWWKDHRDSWLCSSYSGGIGQVS